MSDNSSSTGSSGSSTNSWTLLSPEEAAVETVGPVDDGTESLGDVPSLSEEVAGAAVEFKRSDIPVETVLSEEGHQVCQETSPESSEGPLPSSPGRMSPVSHLPIDPADADLESQPPVIHDIDTSSPSDIEPLGATPFVTNIDLRVPLDIPPAELAAAEPEESCSAPLSEVPIFTEPVVDTPAHIGPIAASHAGESPEINIPTETLTVTDPPSHVEADIRLVPEITEAPKPDPESLVTEHPVDEGPAPETIGSVEAHEEAAVGKEETDAPVTVSQDEREEEEEEPSTSFDLGDTSFDDGLRRRNVSSFEAPRPRTSDEEDEEEEVEFKMAEKKEEKPWFSLNKCIVGALILLFLGSLFLSGDFDASELSDGEQSQDWLNSDPQDMKALLDKLTQENQQITLLEAQLQSQKEELDSALKAVAANGDEKVKADLEKENTRLKEELSSLPELKKELESLRARVTELSQLTDTAHQEVLLATPSSALQPDDKDGQSIQTAAEPEQRKGKNEESRLKEELRRQKGLLEESRKRLEGMKKHGGDRKHVRDSLEEIQRKLSEQVEKWGKKKPQESKWKGNKGKGYEQDNRKKEEKKEGRGEKERKHGKEGGWKEKEEKKEVRGKKEWKHDREGGWKEKEEKKEVRGEKEWKHDKEGGRKEKEKKKEGRGEKEWKHGREGGWKEKEEKKEGRGEKERKHGKEGGWKEKEEKKEGKGEKEWKHGREEGWKEKEEKKEKESQSQKENSHKEAWRKHQDEWERKKDERRMDREERRKEKPWHSRPGKNSHSHQYQHHHHHHQPRQPHQHNNNDFWRDQEQKLQRNIRPQLGCSSVEDCASKEGLYPVELPEFEELLEGYLSKLEGSSTESKDKIRKLTADFFEDGVFIHDRVLFSDFAEDVADILEDMVDVLEGNGQKDDDSLEEEMEEFEREALWKFAATA